MEKILLGAYLSILAAFITATASIVKLVNEKESKTTDYRQSWTDSVRNALSNLIGALNLQAAYISQRPNLVDNLVKAHDLKPDEKFQEGKAVLVKDIHDSLAELTTLIRENRQSIHKHFALTSLHFKPNDTIFCQIEHKYEHIERLLEELVKLSENDQEAERRETREKISSLVNDITQISRSILKTEWESVKAGEPAYKSTKKWSQFVGAITFAILLLSGIYMLAYYHSTSNSIDPAKTTDACKFYNNQPIHEHCQPAQLTINNHNDGTRTENPPTEKNSKSK